MNKHRILSSLATNVCFGTAFSFLLASANLHRVEAQQFPAPQRSNSHANIQNGKASAPSSNQMMNMLDEVASGKSPTLPRTTAHKFTNQTAQEARSVTGVQSRMLQNSQIMRPHGLSPGLGGMTNIRRPSGIGHLGRGMGMGLGAGLGAGAIGTMGGGSHINGAGAAQFMQQLKQKFGALQPGEGMPGAAGGGMPGAGGGMPAGNPFGAGASPFGGAIGGDQNAAPGGMQAQLMQRLFHGGAPGGAPAMGHAAGPAGSPPGGMGFGNMAPIARPQSAFQQSADSSVIKRPPGINGITGGAAPAARLQPSSSAGDLERQMEQQYGR